MENQSIDVKEIFAVIREHKKGIGLCALAGALLAGAYTLVVTPTYESVSLLRIKQQQGLGSSILDALPSGSASMTKQQMSTNAEILKSRNVIVPVIEAFEEKDSNGEYPEYEKYVKKHISTTPFKDTELLQVSVTSDTPEKAQQLNTMIVEGFLKRLEVLSKGEKTSIRKFIEGRLGDTKKDLVEAEKKLQQYQSDHKIYSPNEQIKTLSDKIALVDKAKAENDLNLEQAKAALASVEGQLSTSGVAFADNAAIQQIKVQLVRLEEQKAGLLNKYTNEHPDVVELNRKISEMQGSLATEVQAVIDQKAPSTNAVQQGLLMDKFKNEAYIAVAEGKAGVLNQLAEENNKLIETFPEQERGFIQVKRDANVAQEIYIMLAKRFEEAKVAEVMEPNEVQVVDAATLPITPIKPQKLMITLLGLIVGLLGSTAYYVFHRILNRKVRTVEDVNLILDLPVLGSIPMVESMSAVQDESNKGGMKFWEK